MIFPILIKLVVFLTIENTQLLFYFYHLLLHHGYKKVIWKKTPNTYEQAIIFDLQLIINEHNVCFKMEKSRLDRRLQEYYDFDRLQV